MIAKMMTAPGSSNIDKEYDEESHDYYIVWQPIIISLGKTKQKALDDLREAAHFSVDTLIDVALRGIG